MKITLADIPKIQDRIKTLRNEKTTLINKIEAIKQDLKASYSSLDITGNDGNLDTLNNDLAECEKRLNEITLTIAGHAENLAELDAQGGAAALDEKKTELEALRARAENIKDAFNSNVDILDETHGKIKHAGGFSLGEFSRNLNPQTKFKGGGLMLTARQIADIKASYLKDADAQNLITTWQNTINKLDTLLSEIKKIQGEYTTLSRDIYGQDKALFNHFDLLPDTFLSELKSYNFYGLKLNLLNI